MKLAQLLSQRKEAILERWFDLIVRTYPGLSAVFLKKNHRWGNPVGTNINGAIELIYEELLLPEASDNLAPLLNTVVRIRTVQDYMPSEAVAILLFIKHVVREQLKKEIDSGEVPVSELLEFENRVDTMMLIAFDIYTQCRNTVMQNKLDDFKRNFTTILRKKDIIVDYPKFDSGTSESGDG